MATFGRRRWLFVLATLAFGVFAAVTPAADVPAPSTRPAFRVRVMTFNVHHGAGSDGKFDLERIARIVGDTRPDVVALQEVDVKTRRVGVDMAEHLARLTGMQARFGKAMPYQGGEYGQLILSRWPILEFETLKLPGPSAGSAEPRIAVIATFAAAEGRPAFRVVGTHLHHLGEGPRLKQAEAIAARLLMDGPDALPTVLLGDLNAASGSSVVKLLSERWVSATPDDALTHPATQPTVKIDWVLFDKAHPWRVVEAKVLDEPTASDHRPVVAELELGGR